MVIQHLVIDMCQIMRQHGFQRASMSALMELLGVPPEKAQKYQGHYVELDQDLDIDIEGEHQRRLLMSSGPSNLIH